MKYLKKFNSISELNEFKNGDNYLTPNISLCNDKIEIDSKNSISCTFDIATGGETTLVSPNVFKSFILDGVEQIHSNPTVHTVKNNLQFEYAGVTSSYKIKPITPLIRINEEFTVENLRVGLVNQNGNAVTDSLLDPMMIHGNIINVGMLAVQNLGNTNITSCYCVLFDQIQNHIYDQTIISADGSEYHFEPIEIPVETLPILPSEFMMSQESIMTSLMNFQQQFKFKLDNFQSGTIALFIQLGEQMAFLPYEEGLFSYDGTYYTLSDAALMGDFGMIFALIMPAFGATTSEDITTGWLPIEIHYRDEVIVPEPVPYGQQLAISSAITFDSDVIDVKLYSEKKPTHILGLAVTTSDNKEIFVRSWSEYIGDGNYVDENIYKLSSPLIKQFNSSTAKKLFVLSTSTEIEDIIPDALVEYKFVTSDFSNLVNLESGEHTLDITIVDGVNPILDFNTNLTSIIWNTDKCNLGSNQFRYCTKLQKVRLPDSVKYIPPYCFYTVGDINLPQSLEVLDTYACSGHLGRVELPTSLRFIGDRALINSDISRLPENITNIGIYALGYNPTNIVVKCNNFEWSEPDNTTASGIYYFDSYDQLYSVIARNGMGSTYYVNGAKIEDLNVNRNISYNIFKGVSINKLTGTGVREIWSNFGNINELNWDNISNYVKSYFTGTLCTNDVIVGGKNLKDGTAEITLPETECYIDNQHFMDCNVKSLTLPEGFSPINFRCNISVGKLISPTFNELCKYQAHTGTNISVKSLEINGELVSEDLEIPSGCRISSCVLPSGLKTLTIKSGGFLTFYLHTKRIAEKIYIEDIDSFSVQYYGKYQISTFNGEYASPFANPTMGNGSRPKSTIYLNGELLEHINYTGYNINSNQFYQCDQIKTVTLNLQSSIGLFAFSGCVNLTNITVKVSTFNDYAFAKCTKLASVDVEVSDPTNHVSWGNVFDGCTSLTSITCRNTTCPRISSKTFNNISSTGTLNVPTGSNYSSWLNYLGSGWTINYI